VYRVLLQRLSSLCNRQSGDYLQPKKSRKTPKKYVDASFAHESMEMGLPLSVVSLASSLSHQSNVNQALIANSSRINLDVGSLEGSSLLTGPPTKRRKVAAESKLTKSLICDYKFCRNQLTAVRLNLFAL
jgi:hypothetical protein